MSLGIRERDAAWLILSSGRKKGKALDSRVWSLEFRDLLKSIYICTKDCIVIDISEEQILLTQHQNIHRESGKHSSRRKKAAKHTREGHTAVH